MTFLVGDIVQLVGFDDDLWVVFDFMNSVGRWRVRKHETSSRKVSYDRIAGEGDMTLLLRPTLSIGQTLKHDDHIVTVLSADAESVTIMLSASARREQIRYSSDHVAFGPGQAIIERGALVAENVSRILNAQLGG
jgi:hypothetical protein